MKFGTQDCCWVTICYPKRSVAFFFSEVDIVGYFTNHSLHATAATCMFHARVDEQLIMHRTGHSSTSAVCSHKRLSDPLKEMTSSVLNSNIIFNFKN